MKPPSKTFIIVMIAVILVFVIIQIILPDDNTVKESNLIVSIDTDVPIGSIQVNYARWDSTLASEGVQNADGSMMGRGDRAGFDIAGWPATVIVCGDLQGREVLAQLVIEAAPEDSHWTATIYDSGDGLSISLR